MHADRQSSACHLQAHLALESALRFRLILYWTRLTLASYRLIQLHFGPHPRPAYPNLLKAAERARMKIQLLSKIVLAMTICTYFQLSLPAPAKGRGEHPTPSPSSTPVNKPPEVDKDKRTEKKTSNSSQKGPETAVAFSQAISQWAVLILGGSVALLLGSSYLRPRTRRGRCWYLLFLPAWGCFLFSLKMGMNAQQNLLALTNFANANGVATKTELSDSISKQMSTFEAGLSILGIWLLGYLFWWIRHAKGAQQ